eukprot:TRINITY_DN3929_c0_g1_i1.p1 TRINITY_DN3929_c0_g1~~TRINITY_DN3929_c0_g1_i1.p1  ORF type:complete len:244 (-),score=68.27 TRINITY_DN3929_c0_g1_i1:99-830(-)
MSYQAEQVARPFTVLVEGNIGCGKTTFLEHFAQFSQVEVLKEPVDRWRDVNGHNLLQLMYEDPARWAMPFQSYVQLTMLDHHLHKSGKPIKLMERSIYSSRYCFVENLHKSGKMLGCEFEVLDEWFKFATDNSGLNINVDLIIYLRTTPEKALERVNIRNRSEENSIPLEYLKDLHDLHEDWLMKKKYPLAAPVLVIDADQDMPEMQAEYRKHEPSIFGSMKTDLLQSAIRRLASKQMAPASV